MKVAATSPRRAALVAAVTAGGLTTVKAAIGVWSGSMAVLAAAADNLMDLACSGLNAYFLALAAKPADAEHRFGHGKAEALSGVIQGTIIALGGLYIGGRSLLLFLLHHRVRGVDTAIAVSLASIPVSLALGLGLRAVARRHSSVALRADAFHYLMDVATNVVAAAALGLVRWTGWAGWDLVGSAAIAAYIVQQAVAIVREAADELLDRGLPHELERAVVEEVAAAGPEVLGYTDLRTRRAGRTVFIELRLKLDRSISFERSHELTEQLIAALRRRFGDGTQVMVDTDPG